MVGARSPRPFFRALAGLGQEKARDGLHPERRCGGKAFLNVLEEFSYGARSRVGIAPAAALTVAVGCVAPVHLEEAWEELGMHGSAG